MHGALENQSPRVCASELQHFVCTFLFVVPMNNLLLHGFDSWIVRFTWDKLAWVAAASNHLS